MKTEDRLQLKFKLMILEVEKRISYKLDIPIGSYSKEPDYSDISPLRIIFPDYVNNPYIKMLVSKVSTVLPHKSSESWTAKCEGSNTFLNPHKRMELASLYVQMHGLKRGYFCAFVFWGMIGVVVNRADFDSKLSAVVDFARVFGLSEEEILDIAQVAKAFFGEYEFDFKFETEEAENVFATVYSYLTA